MVSNLPELLERAELEFVLVSVSPPAAAEVIASVASTGMPVLTETPPGQTVAELERLTALTRNGAHIQVAEQYQFQPLHAARIALARDGRLGDITQAQMSAAHAWRGFHGRDDTRLRRRGPPVGQASTNGLSRC